MTTHIKTYDDLVKDRAMTEDGYYYGLLIETIKSLLVAEFAVARGMYRHFNAAKLARKHARQKKRIRQTEKQRNLNHAREYEIL